LIATHSCQCHRFGAFQRSHLRRPALRQRYRSID
jgi:hypothetical protein